MESRVGLGSEGRLQPERRSLRASSLTSWPMAHQAGPTAIGVGLGWSQFRILCPGFGSTDTGSTAGGLTLEAMAKFDHSESADLLMAALFPSG